uniref:Uncharacterized protein n=1 Tax=Oryza meridionalis TaxID=40149 RepID=A0A0E0F1L1_9ORYZ
MPTRSAQGKEEYVKHEQIEDAVLSTEKCNATGKRKTAAGLRSENRLIVGVGKVYMEDIKLTSATAMAMAHSGSGGGGLGCKLQWTAAVPRMMEPPHDLAFSP